MMWTRWLPSRCRRIRKSTAISCAILCCGTKLRLPISCGPISLLCTKHPQPRLDSYTWIRYWNSIVVSDAVRAWRELANISPEINAYLPQSGNLVVNPGFEQEILNGGFDWRITPLDKIAVEETTEDPFKGEHSLAVTFDTSTSGTAGILQLSQWNLAPSYSLSFAYKAEELEGAHGISAVVSDAYTGKALTSTDEILGSTPWLNLAGHSVPARQPL